MEWKSVYAFSVEMSACSEAAKIRWQKIEQYVFSKWKENISVSFQLEYQISLPINHHFLCFCFLISELIYFLLSLVLLSLFKEEVWYESDYWLRKLVLTLLQQFNESV